MNQSSAQSSTLSITDSLNNFGKNLTNAAEQVVENTSNRISSGINQASEAVSSLTVPTSPSSIETLNNPLPSEETLNNPPLSKTRKHGKKRCNIKRKSKIRPKCKERKTRKESKKEHHLTVKNHELLMQNKILITRQKKAISVATNLIKLLNLQE